MVDRYDFCQNDGAVCPYCCHEHDCSEELSNSGIMTCEECDKTFVYERETNITYDTRCYVHDWADWTQWEGATEGQQIRRCKQCGDSEFRDLETAAP